MRIIQPTFVFLKALLAVQCWTFNAHSHAIDFSQILDQAIQADSQIATLSLSKATTQERHSRAKQWLNLNGFLGFNTLYNSTYFSGVLDSQSERQNYRSNALNVSITQPIYNPLRSFNIEESALQSDLESVQMIVTRNELAVRLVQVMLEMVGARFNAESYAKDSQFLHEGLALLIEKGTEDEKLSHNIRIAQAEGQHRAAVNLHLQKKYEMLRLIGSSNQTLNLSFKLLMDPLAQFNEMSLDEIFALAENNNMALRLQKIMVDLASAMVKRTSREKHPTVDLIATATHFVGAPLFPKARNELVLVGVQVQMPFGESGVTNNFRSEALLQESRAKNEVQAQRKLVQQNISDTFYEYKNLINQLNIERRILKMRSSKKNNLPNGIDEMYIKLGHLEETIGKEQSLREISRIERDIFINSVKLWSFSGPLDEQHLMSISRQFN